MEFWKKKQQSAQTETLCSSAHAAARRSAGFTVPSHIRSDIYSAHSGLNSTSQQGCLPNKKVPLMPPTGQKPLRSVGGDKVHAQTTKPPLAPKPDLNKFKRHQPAAPVNTGKPVSSECTPSSGGPKTEKSPPKMDFQGREDHVRALPHDRPMPTRARPNVPFKLPTGQTSHPSEDSDKDPAHPTKLTTPPKPDLRGLAEPPYGTADKRGANMYLDNLLEMTSDEERSRLLSAIEGLLRRPNNSNSPGSDFEGFDTPWRSVDWSAYQNIRDNLRIHRISSPEVKCLRILVHGPVGAGKSSFVNSVASIFQERIAYGAAVDAMTGTSFTKTLQTHYIQDCKFECPLPFAICDIMGLENEDFAGLQIDDLIKVLQGHIKDGYKFKCKPCSKGDSSYLKNPSLNDRIHCLVSVIPADILSLLDEPIINKMRKVRSEAVELNIPQMVVLTKVDLVCPAMAKDLKLIYRSKKIKQKMQECSNRLGVPMNCIFPVKNYHEETDLIDEVNVLVLSALKHILDCANDYVINMSRSLQQTNKKK